MIGGSQARHTVVVSNVIEALSKLSVPELTGSIRIIVSGTTRLEKIAAQVLLRSQNIVLIEYGSGRRCGRIGNCASSFAQVLENPGNFVLASCARESLALKPSR